MKDDRLPYSWCGLFAVLLLNVAVSPPVHAATLGAAPSSHTQGAPTTSTLEAQVEFEETDSALIHLREHNGRYTLSATYLEDRLGNFEFTKHVIKGRPITRRDYVTIWNALKDAEFWQASSMPWPASDQQEGQIGGIIRIKAADGSRRHEVAEYTSLGGAWLGPRAGDKRREAIRRVAGMIVDLAERPARAK